MLNRTFCGFDEIFDKMQFLESDFLDASEGFGDGLDVDLEIIL